MDSKALSEAIVGLWDDIEDAWLKTHKQTLPIEAHVAMFERADAHVITEIIEKHRAERYNGKEAKKEEPPTDKQIAYAKDLGIDKPEQYSRKELSDKIDEARKK